jgi:hypothetical protein
MARRAPPCRGASRAWPRNSGGHAQPASREGQPPTKRGSPLPPPWRSAATVDRQTGLLREIEPWPHADPDQDEFGVEQGAVVEPDPAGLYRGKRRAETMTMCLLWRAREIAKRRSEHPLHPPRLGRDDMDLDFAVRSALPMPRSPSAR